jgi:hypothetical protein
MLLVGREINIDQAEIICRQCRWEDTGSQLSIGLIKVNQATRYLVIYRCPACRSFDLSRKGKLPEFHLPQLLRKKPKDTTALDADNREENRLAPEK